jgi:division protein CdvB (Snf7/Vps24/ESCRT-III family)
MKIQAGTAIQDKTYNNIKASRGSVTDFYTQSITKITSDREAPVEVFDTLATLRAENATLREQMQAILSRMQSLETRLNELVVEN